MPSFSIPLSGLDADSTALNTIANNLANLNTTAFKAQTATFSDLFYQQIGSAGSGDPIEVGAGTQVASTETDFTPGSATPTGTASDVALTGSGFFVVDNNGINEYTRDGTFNISSDGHLTTQAGLNVLGYPATNGVVSTDSALTPIQLPVGQVEAPSATQNMSVTANLDSTSGATDTSLAVPVTVYDSLGNAQVATITFTKSTTATNTWTYSVALPPGAATGAVGAGATGTLTFDSNGVLSTINGAAASSTAGTVALSFAGLTDGASDLNFNWNFYNSNGKPVMTQVASTSASSASDEDGYAAGTYSGYVISPTGVVSAQYSNSQTSAIGQLAVASVTNEQGLTRLGDNNYATTLASGEATTGVADSGGRGAIVDSATEASNVDISTEFANLIVAQRAFEANSKAVTTFDTVAQETINLIH